MQFYIHVIVDTSAPLVLNGSHPPIIYEAARGPPHKKLWPLITILPAGAQHTCSSSGPGWPKLSTAGAGRANMGRFNGPERPIPSTLL